MTLITGSPIGSVQTPEDIFLTDAPSIYFQDATANPLFNPDTVANGSFYWGLSGTATYPVYEVGCPLDVSLTENITINDVRCDTVGVKDSLQQRNYVEFTFTLQSFFPFATLTNLLKGGAVTRNTSSHMESFGLGVINNNLFWHVYAPKVYDETNGDYIMIHLHRCKFVDAFTMTMPFGSPWQITGVKLRAFADTTKSSAQRFGVIMRSDASVIV